MRKHRSSFLLSLLMVVLCGSIIIGSTLAYFTSEQTTDDNIIAASTLKAGLDWAYQLPGSEDGWQNAANGVLFNETSWEPNYSAARYIRVKNGGSLAFSYELNVLPTMVVEGGPELMDVIDVYYGVVDADTPAITRSNFAQQLTRMGTMTELLSNEHGAGYGILLPEGVGAENLPAGVEGENGSVTACIVLHMQQQAGNEYMGLSAGEGFKLQLAAVQYNYDDAFANIPNPSLPDVNGYGTEVIKPLESVQGGVLAADMVFTSSNGVTATVPAGAKVDAGVTELKLIVTPKAQSDADVTLQVGEALDAWEVRVEGLTKDNTVPVRIILGAVMQKSLNIGNYDLYHVEGDATNKMTRVDAVDADAPHNSYSYDPATGEVEVAMATFSEVAVVIDEVNAWKGVLDASWYTDASATSYTIYNADQLAYFGKKVAEGTNFENKTVTLASDINLGAGTEKYDDGSKVIFYSIGTSVDYKQGTSPKAFAGTFDGAGHIITGLYQNGWEMGGNYDNGYFKNAMGLFGLVENGTVQNLTLNNFEMVMEFAPMGCVTAYVDGKCTFKNIAVFNSHPQTYNTAVAGIAGWDRGTSNLTFENITVDNTNTISALWGTYDCCAGGLLGYLGKESSATLTNCHVAAQLDVFNDVCANYQYYWYRYCGMLIGTVDRTTMDASGYTVPDISQIIIKDCSVDYGDWNQYTYCEFKELGAGSYNGPGEWKFCRTTDARCYDDHKHGEDESCTILLPFEQQFGGYGWGVKGINADDSLVEVTTKKTSEKKFYAKPVSLTVGTEYKLSDIFGLMVDYDEVVHPAVQLGITVSEENGAKYTYETSENPLHWEDNKLVFTDAGDGKVHLTIQDYYYCIPTSVDIELIDKQPVEKFVTKFKYTDNFTYRVGNENPVSLKSLFELLAGNEIVGDVNVEIVNTNETSASGIYTPNTNTWDEGTVQFAGTGFVEVSISDDDSDCKPTVLKLQVVDAYNATTATSAKTKNVVLLNDCGFSSLEVSGGYALYGNGFTMTCSQDSYALDRGYGFVVLHNGLIDNVQIVCPNFSYSVLYSSNMKDAGNHSYTDANGKTRYYNVRSAIISSGDSIIQNSRVSGGRSAVYASSGELVIDNCTIEKGAAANIHVNASNTLLLRDVTLIQEPTKATVHDPDKTIMGLSIVAICDADGNAAEISLEGKLIQYAWANKDYSKYVPQGGSGFVDTAMNKVDFIHNITYPDGITRESLNLGILYMPEEGQCKEPIINDDRSNKDDVPYKIDNVALAYVYSYSKEKGTDSAFKERPAYEPEKYGEIIPSLEYSDQQAGLEFKKEFDLNEGWKYTLAVDLDQGPYEFNFNNLHLVSNGVCIPYSVKNIDKAVPVNVQAGTNTYVIQTDDLEIHFYLVGSETSKESPKLVSTNYEAGLCVASSYGGTWHGAAPALEGIQIRYWSVAENQYKTITLSDYTPTKAGKQNDTNTTWTYTPDNGDFQLTLTGGQVHSSNKVYAMPVVCDGKLYFVAQRSNGLVNSGNSARTIPVSYSFKDNNNGEELTFSHTWSVAENKEKQYKYSDFCNGTLTQLKEGSGGGGNCLAAGTLITMEDGSKRAVEDLRKGDKVIAYDHLTGKVTSNKVIIVVRIESDFYQNTFIFDDGTKLVTINEHGIYDLDLNRYVNIDHINASDYIGHEYVAIDTQGQIGTKKLVAVDSEYMHGFKYDIVTEGTLNYVAEDTLSVTHVLVDIINTFEFDDQMCYDKAKMEADIQQYGLFTFEEWKDRADQQIFEEYNIPVMKVGVAKGMYTEDYILGLINTYVLDESVQIID